MLTFKAVNHDYFLSLPSKHLEDAVAAIRQFDHCSFTWDREFVLSNYRSPLSYVRCSLFGGMLVIELTQTFCICDTIVNKFSVPLRDIKEENRNAKNE
jgi:hypothetical protein